MNTNRLWQALGVLKVLSYISEIWIFWYCFDDHLADFLDLPTLGNIPLWAWLLWGFLSSTTTVIRYNSKDN